MPFGRDMPYGRDGLRPINCNLKFHFEIIISQFRINNRPAGMIKETATPNFDALYGAERSFS
jgi:hypothetical protein